MSEPFAKVTRIVVGDGCVSLEFNTFDDRADLLHVLSGDTLSKMRFNTSGAPYVLTWVLRDFSEAFSIPNSL